MKTSCSCFSGCLAQHLKVPVGFSSWKDAMLWYQMLQSQMASWISNHNAPEAIKSSVTLNIRQTVAWWNICDWNVQFPIAAWYVSTVVTLQTACHVYFPKASSSHWPTLENPRPGWCELVAGDGGGNQRTRDSMLLPSNFTLLSKWRILGSRSKCNS